MSIFVQFSMNVTGLPIAVVGDIWRANENLRSMRSLSREFTYYGLSKWADGHICLLLSQLFYIFYVGTMDINQK